MFSQPLTRSWFPCGDGEKRPPVTTASAHICPAMANAETNGETENARNVGQLGIGGNDCTVNELPGKWCRVGNWLPAVDAIRTLTLDCVAPPGNTRLKNPSLH